MDSILWVNRAEFHSSFIGAIRSLRLHKNGNLFPTADRKVLPIGLKPSIDIRRLTHEEHLIEIYLQLLCAIARKPDHGHIEHYESDATCICKQNRRKGIPTKALSQRVPLNILLVLHWPVLRVP